MVLLSRSRKFQVNAVGCYKGSREEGVGEGGWQSWKGLGFTFWCEAMLMVFVSVAGR